MDETGSFFRDTTRKSYHLKDIELAGGKRSKERLTVALCASMTGEKLQPLVIGKSAPPRCFSKIKPENLPVMYRNNKKAWMTTDLLTEWLKTVNKQMKRQNRNILLFLDNALSHPQLSFEHVKVAFLPANTTSLSQPMDQGIIQALKLKYRKRQLQYILSQMERTDKCGSDVLKQVSVLDAIYWISASWKDVETSEKCFHRCGFTPDLCVSDSDSVTGDSGDYDEDDIPLAVMKMSMDLFGVSFKELVDVDQCVPICDMNTSPIDWDAGAVNVLQTLKSTSDAVNDDDCDDDDENDCGDSVHCVSSHEAGDMIEKLKLFALKDGQEKMLDNIMELQELFLSSRCEAQSKQSKILDFFQKC